MFFVISIDYHSFAHWSNVIYVINILVLLLVLFSGEEGGGAQRWIGIGSFRLQPSEFAKLALVITLSRHLEKEIFKYPAGSAYSFSAHGCPDDAHCKTAGFGNGPGIGSHDLWHDVYCRHKLQNACRYNLCRHSFITSFLANFKALPER